MTIAVIVIILALVITIFIGIFIFKLPLPEDEYIKDPLWKSSAQTIMASDAMYPAVFILRCPFAALHGSH